MNPWIRILNLAGVLVLAALCVAQWRVNRSSNQELRASEKARTELERTLDRQAKELQAKAADLEEFRTRVAELAKRSKEYEEKWQTASRHEEQLASEVEQLKTSVSNWVQAVTVRDEQLQTNQVQLKELMTDRNRIVTKFNELSGRHAQLVQQWNDQQARLAAAAENSKAGAKPAPAN